MKTKKPNLSQESEEEEDDKEEEQWQEAPGKKKRKTSLGSKVKSRTEKQKAPDFKFTTLVELNVFLPAGVAGGDMMGLWKDTLV